METFPEILRGKETSLFTSLFSTYKSICENKSLVITYNVIKMDVCTYMEIK